MIMSMCLGSHVTKHATAGGDCEVEIVKKILFFWNLAATAPWIQDYNRPQSVLMLWLWSEHISTQPFWHLGHWELCAELVRSFCQGSKPAFPAEAGTYRHTFVWHFAVSHCAISSHALLGKLVDTVWRHVPSSCFRTWFSWEEGQSHNVHLFHDQDPSVLWCWLESP